jgi:hypothetical protein
MPMLPWAHRPAKDEAAGEPGVSVRFAKFSLRVAWERFPIRVKNDEPTEPAENATVSGTMRQR